MNETAAEFKTVHNEKIFSLLSKKQKIDLVKHYDLWNFDTLFDELFKASKASLLHDAARKIGYATFHVQSFELNKELHNKLAAEKSTKSGYPETVKKEWTCFDISKPTEFNKKSKNLGNRLRSRR